MYRLTRRMLFLFPPEWVHYFSMNCLRLCCRLGFSRKMITKRFSAREAKPYSLFNMQFVNRVGLGAGFDKNARWVRELECLGFGFIEIGTVTPLAQAGNEKPRLFRLKKDKALINRMGFNNEGADAVAARLKKFKIQHPTSNIVIGGNIGKNKATPNEDAWKDYETCFKALHPYVDYFVVNVSSPNTPGLRALQEKESLRKILQHVQAINKNQAFPKPVLLKIAPDLEPEQIKDVVDLAMEINLDGIVATNTTIDRSGLIETERAAKAGAGGLSGLPLKEKAFSVLQSITEKTGGRIPVIASGGIFTREDAEKRFAAGASLVQVWTGFIYEGPGIVRKIVG